MSKCCIARALAGRPGEIEITEGEFAAAIKAQHALVIVATVEETFDVLLENYREYEESLLCVALHNLVHSDYRSNSLREDRRTVARRFANFLTAARSYVEQVQKELGAIGSEKPLWRGAWHKAINHERETCLAFRAIEALRNHVQHHSLLACGVTFPFEWIAEDEGDPIGKLRFRVIPRIDVDRLKRDRTFPSEVLTELTAAAKTQGKEATVPLTPLVRQYVESVGKAHVCLRDALGPAVKAWEDHLEGIEVRAREGLDGPLVGLAVIRSAEDDLLSSEVVYLAREELASYRRELEQRNPRFEKFARRFVSGEQ